MITNQIYIATRGKNPKKFEQIPEFQFACGKELYKMVLSGFRLAGKVGDFVRENAIATAERGYNYNGYGYQDHERKFLLTSKAAKELEKILSRKKAERAAHPRKVLSEEEKTHKWAQRLSKLTGISIEEAEEIAEEKMKDKWSRIEELEWRQDHLRYSDKRQVLIDSLYRSNPLRRIEGPGHAAGILIASRRHRNSDYEWQLDIAHQMAEDGELDRSEVRAYARMNMTYFTDDEEKDDNK